MRAAALEPLDAYVNNYSPWRCRCLRCGREVSPSFLNVSQGQTGCAYCARVRVDAGAAVAAMRRARLEPLDTFPGAARPWRCKCLKCHRTVMPAYGNVRSGQGGCIWCAQRGFDPAAITDLYLVTSSYFDCHKIGIARKGSMRLKNFQRAGWQAFRTHRFATGLEAYQVEQAVLAHIRAVAGLPPFLSRREMRNGWTETVSAEAISLLDLWGLVESHLA